MITGNAARLSRRRAVQGGRTGTLPHADRTLKPFRGCLPWYGFEASSVHTFARLASESCQATSHHTSNLINFKGNRQTTASAREAAGRSLPRIHITPPKKQRDLCQVPIIDKATMAATGYNAGITSGNLRAGAIIGKHEN